MSLYLSRPRASPLLTAKNPLSMRPSVQKFRLDIHHQSFVPCDSVRICWCVLSMNRKLCDIEIRVDTLGDMPLKL